MAIQVEDYRWHKVWHSRLMSNPAYLALPLDMRGAHQTLKNLAGQRNNGGSIRIGGSERLTYEQVIAYIAAIPVSARRNTGTRRARVIVDRLLFDGFLWAVKRDEWRQQKPWKGCVILLADWMGEQLGPPTSEAARKRNERAKREFQNIISATSLQPPSTLLSKSANLPGQVTQTETETETEDTDVSLRSESDLNKGAGRRPPAASPPPTRSGAGSGRAGPDNSGSGPDLSGRAGPGQVRQQAEPEVEPEREREADGAPSQSAAGSGSGPEVGGGEAAGEDLVLVYCKAIGEFDERAKNAARDQLQKMVKVPLTDGQVAALLSWCYEFSTQCCWF